MLWLELVNSLHDFLKEDRDFTPEVILGFGGEIPREPHVRVCWGAGSMQDESGLLETPQGIFVEGWVHDKDGNNRREAYGELAALLKTVVAYVDKWATQNNIELTLTVLNHEDAFAPDYGFQLNLNTTVSQELINCSIFETLSQE